MATHVSLVALIFVLCGLVLSSLVGAYALRARATRKRKFIAVMAGKAAWLSSVPLLDPSFAVAAHPMHALFVGSAMFLVFAFPAYLMDRMVRAISR